MQATTTYSEENYLKAIYRIAEIDDTKKISITAISEALNNTLASVTEMIKKLSSQKLISYDKKVGVEFTSEGKEIALQIVRKHRLWELFLHVKLNFPWDEIHDIAEQLEHINNSKLADKLDEFLGFPQFDPHGDPIPQANGELPTISNTTLEKVEVGTKWRLVGVKDTTTEFLQYLKQTNLAIGSAILVVEKIAYDGSLVIQIDTHLATLSKMSAGNILVAA